jgi:glycosyltransferase involved in cell wall biosynthesis
LNQDNLDYPECGKQRVLIVTNIEFFPATWTSTEGQPGESVIANSVREFLQYRERSDAIFLVHCDPGLCFRLAKALWFHHSPDLVSVDLVLRVPHSLKSRFVLIGRRLLLRRFNHHIHYFRNVEAYRKVYGITPEKSSYVPFKPNPIFKGAPAADGNGEYVLCFGQSMRDFDTFFRAIEKLEFPAAIPKPDFALLRKHGSRFTRPLNKLPVNVKVLPDDKCDKTQKQMILDARLVVLPIRKTSIVASGIGTCLNSMLAGKCVIGTEGPGMSDIFEKEMLFVPAEDPEKLAQVIRQAWEDAGLRQRTAEAGQKLAKSLGGEQELCQRIIDAVVGWSCSRREHGV